MTTIIRLELQRDLINLCKAIGKTTDVTLLREQFVTANGLWARIDRVTEDPPKTA